MNKNENFVITINRELGSGGRTVGRLIAEKLGVPYFDKALIQALQKEYNLSVAEIEKLKGLKQGWWSEVQRIFSIGPGITTNYYMPMLGEEPDVLTTDEVFETETAILEKLATEGSCIVAGRSGFHVFRKHPNHLSILIQASLEYRLQRIMDKQNLAREDALKTIKKVDKMRENYVKKYTRSSRYDTRNYQLVISADDKTEEEIADLILRYIG
jgi:cytidylate kinase